MRVAMMALAAAIGLHGAAWADDPPAPTRAEQLAAQLTVNLIRADAQIDDLEKQVATLREQVASLTKAMRAQLGAQQPKQ